MKKLFIKCKKNISCREREKIIKILKMFIAKQKHFDKLKKEKFLSKLPLRQ